MSKKLSVGDIVECQYYNTPEGKFYGERFRAVIVEIDDHHYFNNTSPDASGYKISKLESGSYKIWLHRKEIKRRLS